MWEWERGSVQPGAMRDKAAEKGALGCGGSLARLKNLSPSQGLRGSSVDTLGFAHSGSCHPAVCLE